MSAGGDGKVEERKTLSAFHSTKTSDLNFRQLPAANITGTSFQNFQKRGQPREVYMHRYHALRISQRISCTDYVHESQTCKYTCGLKKYATTS